LLILASIVVCVWTLLNFGSFPDEVWFVVLEGILFVAVLADVSLRIYLQGFGSFLLNWMNLFDLAVIVLSVIAVVAALASDGFFGEVEGLSGQILLVLYCGVQYLRLALFLKNQSQTKVQDLEILGYQDTNSFNRRKAHLASFSSDD
jgi:hypothetical protein